MKLIATALALLLAACAAQPPPLAVPPPVAAVCPDVPAAAVPAPPAKAATAAATATRAYHKAEAAESRAVTGGAATAAYIGEIRQADRLAREALRLLVAQDGHPTPDAIAGAKRSLDDLVTALEATPQ
jgi:hypothetical protein